jgi:hypothetical protein
MWVYKIKSLKINGLKYPTACFKQLQTFGFCRYIKGYKSSCIFKKDGAKLVHKAWGYAPPPTLKTPIYTHLGKRSKGV